MGGFSKQNRVQVRVWRGWEGAVGEEAGKGPARKTPSMMHTYCAYSMYTFDTVLGSLSPNENEQSVQTTPYPMTRSAVLITGLDQIPSLFLQIMRIQTRIIEMAESIGKL